MRNPLTPLLAALALLCVPAAAHAQDDDSLEGIEMDVLDSHETPNEASTRVLTLPESASDQARTSAQPGLDRANAARTDGAAFGEATSEAARDAHGGGRGDHGKPDDSPSGP